MSSGESSEHGALLHSLNTSREYLRECIQGLSEEDVRRPVLPSAWTCLGVFSHLAFDVEYFWFQAVVAGDAQAIDAVQGGTDNAWIVPPDSSVTSVLERYRRASERSDEIIRSSALDGAPVWWPSFFGSWRLDSIRAVVLHAIRETATHGGQLDAARELLDGKQHVVLTD